MLIKGNVDECLEIGYGMGIVDSITTVVCSRKLIIIYCYTLDILISMLAKSLKKHDVILWIQLITSKYTLIISTNKSERATFDNRNLY